MASSSLGLQEEKMTKHEISDVSPEKLKTNLIEAADVKETTEDSSPSTAALEESGISSDDPSTEKQMIANENAITEGDRRKILGKRKLRFDEAEGLPQENAGSTSKATSSSSPYLTRSRTRALGASKPNTLYVKNEKGSLVEMELVRGHVVMASCVPTVRFIFAKYGHIASKTCYLFFPEFSGALLGTAADIVKKVISSDFGSILSELDNMKALTDSVALAYLDVSWLRKELAEIEEVRKLAIKAASRDFGARKKIMDQAKKRLKEVQRRLDHVTDAADVAEYYKELWWDREI